MTMSCVSDKNINHFERYEVRRKIALTHLLYTISVLFNLVVVAIYWPVIHPDTIEKHRKDGPEIKVTCQYMVHSIPAAACFINLRITNMILLHKVIKPVITLGGLYCIINFVVTKYRGAPIYAFLHW